ncbi:hypothetical protein JAAARDRAFT_187676 [Jaapia argillacea MUCL 33604]|uniref:Transmembrane protein n=1 Tax=Jaapia argillacea MUCL 33604 TaxID=933084 RepID=A0A067QB90_9AGAM|nr:hypothetical protein JAAARDRAFT_187676 [Jaapia argillacea MUCL 33604]
MRHSPSCASRILTVFSLALLLTLSFVVVLAQNPNHVAKSPLHKRGIRAVIPSPPVTDTPVITSTQASSSPAETATTSSVASPPPSSTPITTSSSKPYTPPPSSSSSQQPPPSSAPPASSPTTSQAPTVTTSSSSVATVSTSTASAPSTVTAIPNTVSGGTTTTLFVPKATSYHSASGGTTTAAGVNPEVTAGPIAQAASKGFFQSPGEVAATFTIVGLIGVCLAFAGFKYLNKRRRRMREEDEEFFEKDRHFNDHNHDMTEAHSSSAVGYGGVGSSADVVAPASVDAYPSRDVHYGPPPTQAYNQQSARYTPSAYGISYPPNAAYGSAAPRDGQYQQSGYATNDYNQAYYQTDSSQLQHPGSSTSPPPSHPYADPTLLARSGGAPPVVTSPTPTHESVDSYYGSSQHQGAYAA